MSEQERLNKAILQALSPLTDLYRQLNLERYERAQTDFVTAPERPPMTLEERDIADEIYRQQP